MSRLPEFMSQVKCFGSSVIILKLSSYPELLWHLALILLQEASFSVFGYPNEALSLVFDILLPGL